MYAAREEDPEYDEFHAVIEEIIELIKAQMKFEKVDQPTLAKRLGVTQQHISKMLRGGGNYEIRTLVRIARALDVRVRLHFVPR